MSRTIDRGNDTRRTRQRYAAHTLAASRTGSVPIAKRLNAGRIRFESTCCILEKFASMSFMTTRNLDTKNWDHERKYLKLQGDQLVDLIDLIVDGDGRVEPLDNDRRRIGTGLPSGRVGGYGL